MCFYRPREIFPVEMCQYEEQQNIKILGLVSVPLLELP